MSVMKRRASLCRSRDNLGTFSTMSVFVSLTPKPTPAARAVSRSQPTISTACSHEVSRANAASETRSSV